MNYIYLVRHGETEWNKIGKYQGYTDVPLNHIGLAQADRCAEALKDVPFERIITSDLSRAKVTAEKIARYHKNATFTVDERLREINFGDWESLTYDQITGKWPGIIEEMYTTPETVTISNGESFHDVQNRAWPAVYDEIEAASEGSRILVVCHGGTNRTLICKMLELSLHYSWNFRQGNTSISCIEYYGENGHNMLSLLNDISHNRGL